MFCDIRHPVVGAPLAGALSDRQLKKWRARRGDIWVPEDRLRATLFGAAVLVPCSILLSGLLTEYVHGTLGLVLNCLCLFMNGLGVNGSHLFVKENYKPYYPTYPSGGLCPESQCGVLCRHITQ